MRALLIALFAVVAIIVLATTSFATAQSSIGTCSRGSGLGPNTHPVNTEKPVFVRAVKNGKRYTAGQGLDNFTVLHLYGTPYEMGYAQGQLMKNEMHELLAQMTKYLENEIDHYVPFLPKWLIDLVATYGINFLLDLTMAWTKPFTPDYYVQEIQGMADASGLDVKELTRLNLLPEALKAACTIVGAWGKATSNNNVQHLRTLDFSTTMPILNFPQLTIYHYRGNNKAGVNDVANFGWTMLIGSLSGMSSNGLSMGEKVFDKAPESFDLLKGKPWMYMFRDTLAQATNIKHAISMIQDTNRTCAIHLGIGSAKDGYFRGLEVAGKWFKVYNDTSTPYCYDGPSSPPPAHPIIPDTQHWNMHLQPSTWGCISDLLKHYYGNITAEILAVDVAATEGSGDTHVVSYDDANLVAYFANGRKLYSKTGHTKACNRQFSRMDIKSLFDEQQ